MKKVLITIIILAALGGGAWWFLNQDTDPSTTSSQPPAQNTQQEQTEETASPTEAATVRYDGSSFSPATITVKPGTKVNFVNESSRPMWVASDPHPVHTDLSQFEAGRGFTQGQTYSFTFTEEGSWGYHNHLDSSKTGTVVVE